MKRIYMPTSDECGFWDYSAQPQVTLTVHEPDATPAFCGLYDAAGNKLMVKIEREPVGFVHFK